MQAPEVKFTLNAKGRLLSLEKPVIMGIINATPDSFFKSSRSGGIDESLAAAAKMLEEGALILDIGGYSSRPGADDILEEEEIGRVIPVIEAIASRFPEAVISVDTFRSGVASAAISAGAHIINDISAGDDDPLMSGVVARLQVPYIIMHKQGTPKTMQQNPQYNDVVPEVISYLAGKTAALKELGVKDIIIDPGFGFGKTLEHNYRLMNALEDLHMIGVPVLAGISRKGMIGKILDTDADHSLNGTSVLNTIALMKGAKILRVHDVKEAAECIKLVNAVYGNIK